LFDIIKKPVKIVISSAVKLFGVTVIGSYIFDQILKFSMQRERLISHEKTNLKFAIPNKLSCFRVETFSIKEPETLEWIDSIPTGSVLWDIGANVGLYSCYAAKSRKCKVFAFEPSVFNLELLARNIFLNELVSQVVIIPLPLSSELKINTLNMTTTDWGGALSTFGENYGDDGKAMIKLFNFSSLGISMDQVSQLLNIPEPAYIKMDVDGLEHLILSGGYEILAKVQGLIIEVNEDFIEQVDNVNRLCLKAGLVFIEKKHSAMFDNNKRYSKSYNQIWYRQ
jgi:FkbM family methyltransferase